MTTENLVEITWPEVRKGDLLLHENGDRLTVESATYANLTGGTFRVTVATRGFGTEELERIGFTPFRKQPELPNEPGAYLDKDGGYWLLAHEGDWYDWTTQQQPEFFYDDPRKYSPFTRLVPMPTEEQVRKALIEADLRAKLSASDDDATAAVMALLNGEADDA